MNYKATTGADGAGSAPGAAPCLRAALLGALLAALVGAGACAAKPPPDPGLAAEDLGLGISLGMEPAAALEAAGRAAAATEVWVLTREELNKRNPYADRPAGQDLLVALHLPFIMPGSTPGDPVGSGRISELRCYLAEPADSKLTLLGQGAAGLTQESLAALLGPPRETTQSPGGDTHLHFEFTPDRSSRLGPNLITLMASFHTDGNCFALSIALQPRR